MSNIELIEKLKELKDFHDEHPEQFEEITGGVKTLFDAIKAGSPEDVAEGFGYLLDLQTAEGLLDKEIAIKKAGANIISATVSLLTKILVGRLTNA